MTRGLLVGVGVVLLPLGLALAAAGGAVAAALGPTGAVTSSPAHLHGAGVALVADDVTVDAGSLPVPSGLATVTLSVASPDGSPLFVGAAAPTDVDRYLTGAPYDVVVSLNAGTTAQTRAVPGTQRPPTPDTQTFWTAHASGSPATLSALPPARSTVVVMNVDARPGVSADVVATMTVRNAWTAAWTAVGVGALLVALALVALWRARVARRRSRASAAEAALAADAATADTVLPVPSFDPDERGLVPDPDSVSGTEGDAEADTEPEGAGGSVTGELEAETSAEELSSDAAPVSGPVPEPMADVVPVDDPARESPMPSADPVPVVGPGDVAVPPSAVADVPVPGSWPPPDGTAGPAADDPVFAAIAAELGLPAPPVADQPGSGSDQVVAASRAGDDARPAGGAAPAGGNDSAERAGHGSVAIDDADALAPASAPEPHGRPAPGA